MTESLKRGLDPGESWIPAVAGMTVLRSHRPAEEAIETTSAEPLIHLVVRFPRRLIRLRGGNSRSRRDPNKGRHFGEARSPKVGSLDSGFRSGSRSREKAGMTVAGSWGPLSRRRGLGFHIERTAMEHQIVDNVYTVE